MTTYKFLYRRSVAITFIILAVIQCVADTLAQSFIIAPAEKILYLYMSTYKYACIVLYIYLWFHKWLFKLDFSYAYVYTYINMLLHYYSSVNKISNLKREY